MSAPGDGYYDEGLRCGELLARAGFAVATGGYGGTMEAVSRGAKDAGGEVIGVTAPTVFPDRVRANEHVTTETRSPCCAQRNCGSGSRKPKCSPLARSQARSSWRN